LQRLQLFVSGRVQGVFFRGSTEAVARHLGVKGWVRNLPDGRVEVLAEGPREALDELAAWCGRGPSDAFVEKLEVTWSDSAGEFATFEQRR
jgi:acylphosphatase